MCSYTCQQRCITCNFTLNFISKSQWERQGLRPELEGIHQEEPGIRHVPPQDRSDGLIVKRMMAPWPESALECRLQEHRLRDH